MYLVRFLSVLIFCAMGCSSVGAHNSPDSHTDVLNRISAKLEINDGAIMFLGAIIPKVGRIDKNSYYTDDLNFTALRKGNEGLWSKVSRIKGLSSGAALIVKVNMWHVSGIPNNTTAYYMIRGNASLGLTILNDQIKEIVLVCGESQARSVRVYLLEHDTTVDKSQGNGFIREITTEC